jgi:hypothetical protein
MFDKFEDYMKNIDKINQMINEFKGLVAIVRGKAAKKERSIDRFFEVMKQVFSED